MSSLRQTSHASNALIDAASNYAARGWSIIPTIGKRAAGLWKPFQTQPADERTLRRMFSRPKVTGIAVILGSASGGLACRDYDDADAYHRWAADHSKVAARLPTVQTARGFHVYFRGPDAFANLGDGEYRADAGHYCLLPPSVHPDGPTYTWQIPLPDGDLPTVDPVQAGLLTDTQDTHHTQDTQTLRHPSHTTHLCERGNLPIAIAETLPTGFGQRRRKLFDFARKLKPIMPDANGNELKLIVREWFTAALPFIRTKEWGVTWEDFVAAWESVRHTTGGKWEEIVQASRCSTVDTGDHDGAAAAIIRLAAAIQQHHGDGVPWPLSCRKAGIVAGVSHTRAARVLKMLVFDSVLELASPAGPKGSRIAATYRLKK
jgi:hypothetical protein